MFVRELTKEEYLAKGGVLESSNLFDLACHSSWKQWRLEQPIYGIVGNVLFYVNPYFDDGKIMSECQRERKIVKGMVLAYYTFKEDL